MSALSYFMVLEPGGRPLYSHSFGFSDEASCQCFDGHIDESLEKKLDYVIEAYFESLQTFSKGKDNSTNIVKLEVQDFELRGVRKADHTFIAILDLSKKGDPNFTHNYHLLVDTVSEQLSHTEEVTLPELVNFLNTKLEQFFVQDTAHTMRDCLASCVDENKKCIPHRIYYERLIDPELKLAE